MNFFNILTCVGGIALFMFGMTYMSDALKKLSGNQMKNFLTKMTSSPTRGFLIGLLVTMVIQSSTATNVMAVSFVNSSMMSLTQAIPLMIGSNLGTTVTAWLISLSSIDGAGFIIQMLKPASFTPILALIGIILLRFQNNEKKKDVGAILLGFAILMFGMTTMSGAMSGLSSVPGFMKLFDALTNPFLGLVIGLLMAGIMQSSSAAVGVVQALAMSGGITMESVIPLIMGINIGQVLPVMISSAGTSKNARRTALVDLFINLIGAIIFLPVYMILRGVGVLPFLNQIANPVTIAITHTGYKLCVAVILLPTHKLLEKLARKIIREDKVAKKEFLLDPRLIATPSLALASVRQRIQECVNATHDAFNLSVGLLTEWSAENGKLIHEVETMVDRYQDEIDNYLATLSARSMTMTESQELSNLLHMISNYENITDHIYRVVFSYRQLWENNHSFSPEAMDEMNALNKQMEEILTLSDDCYKTNDASAAFKIVALEHEIVHSCAIARENHLVRLQKGICAVQEGSVFTDILLDYERIADHLSKEARLNLVQTYNKVKGADTNPFLSALLDQHPEIEERLLRSTKY